MNILPDQKTVACLVRLLKEAGGDRGGWDKCKTQFSLALFPCDPRESKEINNELFSKWFEPGVTCNRVV